MTINIREFWFAWALAGLVLARAFLVSNTEMVGAQWDTEGLARLTLEGFWNRPSDSMRPPVLPLVSGATMILGLPWRIFLELTFLGATAAVALHVRRCCSAQLALVCTAAILLSPYSLRSFNEFQREPLLLVFYMMWVCTILDVIDHGRFTRLRQVINGTCYGLFAALIILTREGEELFVAGGIVLTGIALAYNAIPKLSTHWMSLLIASASSLAIIIGALLAISFINLAVWGDFHYRALLPSYQKLLTQIHRIEVDDSVRYAPATRKSFEIAAKLSPTFAEFGRRAFANDDDPNLGGISTWREHSNAFVGRREIDPSRTIWLMAMLVNDAYGADDRVLFAKMNAAADEIKRELDKGTWPSHEPSLPYPLDPNIGNWIEYVPMSLVSNLQMLLVPTPHQAGLYRNPDFAPELFDEALVRRATLVDRQYGGIRDYTREWIVAQYWLILFVASLAAVVLALFSSNRMSRVAITGMLVVLGIMGARFVVYSILYASVAPVSRYQVFTGPLAVTVLLIGIWFVSDLVASWIRRKRGGADIW
jgi:hypothetical protein